MVIDAFRLINPQTMMLGQEPRQTTSNLGHLHKPSIQVSHAACITSQQAQFAGYETAAHACCDYEMALHVELTYLGWSSLSQYTGCMWVLRQLVD